jgi:hypothetical protein
MAKLESLHEQVKNAAYEIIQKKGATFYAVALAVSRIVSAIFNDENSVLTVSTYLENEFDGLLQDVYLSLPVVVNAHGAEKILRPDYSEGEKARSSLRGWPSKKSSKICPYKSKDKKKPARSPKGLEPAFRLLADVVVEEALHEGIVVDGGFVVGPIIIARILLIVGRGDALEGVNREKIGGHGAG